MLLYFLSIESLDFENNHIISLLVLFSIHPLYMTQNIRFAAKKHFFVIGYNGGMVPTVSNKKRPLANTYTTLL